MLLWTNYLEFYFHIISTNLQKIQTFLWNVSHIVFIEYTKYLKKKSFMKISSNNGFILKGCSYKKENKQANEHNINNSKG